MAAAASSASASASASSSSLWQSMSQSRVMSRRKGLSNELGANNCFLNVIIQSLWHLRSCRVLIGTGDHALHHRFGGKPTTTAAVTAAAAMPCLLCELEQIFILYQFAEEPVLEVDRVREALTSLFALGAMNDATETLEAILDALHWDTFNRMLALRRAPSLGASQSIEDASSIVCEPQCIAHLLFQMNLMELRSCGGCGETQEPLMNTDFLYRVYAQELLQHSRDRSLEEVLQLEAQGGCVEVAYRPSCDACKTGKMQQSRWILQLPMVFAMSIIWSSDQVSKHEVRGWMELLTRQTKTTKSAPPADAQMLDLGRIFRLDRATAADEGAAAYNFRGMVCYYGRHYVGFFKSRTMEGGVPSEHWYLFDDTRVKRVGAWDDVRSRVERGGYQPTLVFYERRGIQQASLEKVANEIHQWWKDSADAANEDAREDGKADTTSLQMDEGNGRIPMSPIATAEPPTPAPPVKSAPSSTTLLPMSPIQTSKEMTQGLPPSLTQNGGRAWLDEDLSIMHQSAKDTLSRLNGILSREIKPSQSNDQLRMSMSMPRSVRRREYSVRHTGEDAEEINRDAIFKDEYDSPSLAPKATEKTTSVPTMNEPSLAPATSPSAVANKTMIAQKTTSNGQEVHSPSQIFDVVLTAMDGGIGLELVESTDEPSIVQSANRNIVVDGFEVNGAGEKLAAEASGAIEIGDTLVGINGTILESEDRLQVLELLLTAANPVTLTFHRFLPWSCPRCTLLNDPREPTCAACGSEVALLRDSLIKANAKR